MIMQQELLSEPLVVKKAYEYNLDVVQKIAADFKEKDVKNITIIGRGTSDNAGLCFKYITEILCGIPVGNAHPSVTTMYGAKVNYENQLVIAISQSGKSIDTLAVLDQAKKNDAITVAVTNDESSPLARTAKYHLFLNAGPEVALGATKTFAAELTVLYMLAYALSNKEDMKVLEDIPGKLNEVLALEEDIHNLAKSLKDRRNFIVLSRGSMQGVVKELALKLCLCSVQCFRW